MTDSIPFREDARGTPAGGFLVDPAHDRSNA